jgi:phosphoglycerate dehydrogenase-like enzyme
LKIIVADDLPSSALDLLRAEGWEVDSRTGRTPDQLAADLTDAAALVVRSATKVTAALIAAAPQLRVIARAGTGVDNVDVPAASARGIVVMNAPGANSVSVAELAVGLMLAMARHLPAADAAMKQGKWEKKKFLGEEVRDKTLGLAGLGRIGQEVARRAAAFGMRIIAHDPFISEQVAAAALDVFQTEPPPDQRLQKLPQVVATPHIAASTREGQELVGVETAAAMRDFLKDGIIRNAVNFPSVSAEEYIRLRPFIELGERLGAFLAQMNDGRANALGVRYYGELAEGRNDMIVNAVLVGLFTPILEMGITPVNARSVASDRGIEVIESRSNRPRNYTSLISVKLHTSQGERWVEGAVFERTSPRLVLLDGIGIEAPLDGTMIVIRNNDQPGVIGEIGTILGRHGVNIANFALGRSGSRAVGVVIVDEAAPISAEVLADLRKVKAIQEARIVRV